MKAFVVDLQERRLKLVDRDKPRLQSPTDVIVKMVAAGVCGTDVAIVNGKGHGVDGIVNGHEGIGDIVAVGEEVSGIKVGDRVLIQPNIACGDCRNCRKFANINDNFCLQHSTYGIHHDGTMSEFAMFKYQYVKKLPAKFRSINAVLAEPLAAVLHGFNQLHSYLKSQSRILVMGAGIGGLLWIRLLKNRGYGDITCYSRSISRSHCAIKIGAKSVSTGDIDITELTESSYDVIIECTGSEKCFERGIDLLCESGTILLYGMCPPNATCKISPFQLWKKEIKVIASYIYDSHQQFDDAIEAAWDLEQKQLLNVEDFNVGVFTFQDSEEGWRMFLEKKIQKLVVVN